MKKIIITGFSGFVSHHFIQYLHSQKLGFEILGLDINEPIWDYNTYVSVLKIKFIKIDLLDASALQSVFDNYVPDYVLHLASYSSVAYSWKHPETSFVNNTNIFLNLVSVVSKHNKGCRILSVGSSEEYGNVSYEHIPLSEEQPVKPVSPYAIARVSQEMLSKLYSESYQMQIIMTRSFNHIGPYQDTRFVVPSFITRMREILKQGHREGIIETGDISIIRDFVDVRDVVRAYYILLMKGKSGEIYNVCSGRGTSLSEVIQYIADELNVKVNTKVNPEYVRLNDNPIIVGSNAKILNELGWKPEISLKQSIHDIVYALDS